MENKKRCAWCGRDIIPEWIIDKEIYFYLGEDVICPYCIKLVEADLMSIRRQ